ncbi:MAG: hypothetical protein JSU85_08690 [Candidatus Zixiibacteriota bacterium]|nr:MAG: hypothetical protein JSU85_08690 [candidate division Zixibacteria bacterium]
MEKEYKCADCGQIYLTLDAEYIQSYPNASELYIDQKHVEHLSGECPNSSEYDTVINCEYCGEEIFRGSYKYMYDYPNASTAAIGQAVEDHENWCPVLDEKNWEYWRTEVGKKYGVYYSNMTPRELIQAIKGLYEKDEVLDCPAPPDREAQPGYLVVKTWEDEIKEILNID